ncbi:regulator of G-protein signaling domain-containing protein [Streptomyces chartreusis]|uniref:regulator of G-protein signaling domain-containing protein n=1 Tax=Streptomyces chartreusis TaxID=1969 RepID=UPI0033FCC12C
MLNSPNGDSRIEITKQIENIFADHIYRILIPAAAGSATSDLTKDDWENLIIEGLTQVLPAIRLHYTVPAIEAAVRQAEILEEEVEHIITVGALPDRFLNDLAYYIATYTDPPGASTRHAETHDWRAHNISELENLGHRPGGHLTYHVLADNTLILGNETHDLTPRISGIMRLDATGSITSRLRRGKPLSAGRITLSRCAAADEELLRYLFSQITKKDLYFSDQPSNPIQHANLRTYWADPAGREAFKEFARSEHASENIEFLEALEKFDMGRASARKIYLRFFEDIDHAVNVPPGRAPSKAQVMTWRPGKVSPFESAKQYVWEVLELDTWPRFLASKE